MLRRQWKLMALALVFLLIAVGIGYAFWTTSGTGAGSASTDDTQAITVNQTTTVAGLFPGGTAQALAGDFTNSNPGGVQVATVNASIGGVSGPNIAAGTPCTAADYQLNGFPVAVGAEVPNGTNVGSWSGGSIQMLNTATNQNGCKGATVAIAYTIG